MLDALLFLVVVGGFVQYARRVGMPPWVAVLVGSGTWLAAGLGFDAAVLGLQTALTWAPDAADVLHTWVEPGAQTLTVAATALTLRRRERQRVRAVHQELLGMRRTRE